MQLILNKTEPRHDKTNNVTVRPAKTQISLGIRPVWSESSLSAWRNLGPLATHLAHSEDWSDWEDAQADLSLRWAHTHFVSFVMSRLILFLKSIIILLIVYTANRTDHLQLHGFSLSFSSKTLPVWMKLSLIARSSSHFSTCWMWTTPHLFPVSDYPSCNYPYLF